MFRIFKNHLYKKYMLATAIAGICLFSFLNANAQTTPSAEELKLKIEQQAKNIEALNKEIQAYTELKDKTTKEAVTLQNAIKELEKSNRVLDLDIRKTTSQIEKANLEITQIDKTIQSSEEKVIELKSLLTHNVRAIQQSDDKGFIQSILAKENLSDALVEINDRVKIGESIQTQVAELRNEKTTLEGAKVTQVQKKTELSEFQSELTDKKKAVEYNKSEQSKTLAVTKNQEKTYQQLLADKAALKLSFEKELFEYESALKYTLDPASIPRTGSSPLSWPTDNVYVTQRFGKTVGAERLYVSGSHNGVDFRASIGTKIKASLSGTVIGAGDTDLACKGASFGRWVMIRHANGLATMYAHLSVISVKEGDTVTTGQTIGYSGNTGYSTGPHLHFGVYASNAVEVQTRPSISCNGKIYRMPIAPIEAYLDPMLYLPAI